MAFGKAGCVKSPVRKPNYDPALAEQGNLCAPAMRRL